MTVIVHKNEPIDEALRRLQGETLRENIFEVYNDKRYFIKPSKKRSDHKRLGKKEKNGLVEQNVKVKNNFHCIGLFINVNIS